MRSSSLAFKKNLEIQDKNGVREGAGLELHQGELAALASASPWFCLLFV